MNAISLLSGWSANAASTSSSSTRGDSSSSRSRSRAHSRRASAGTRAEKRDENAAPFTDDGAASSLLPRHQLPAHPHPGPAGVEELVKPPEARLYEDIEQLAAQVNGGSPVTVTERDAAAYPSPPPTPPLLSPQDSEPASEGEKILSFPLVPQASSRRNSLGTATPADRPRSSASHDSPDQRKLSERHARIVARSAPVRYLARLYMLIRKFLALFGVHIAPFPSPAQHAVTSPSEATLLLAPPVPAAVPRDQPPSYEHATRGSVTPTQPSPPASRSRWRMPSFRNRGRTPSVIMRETLADVDATSSASDSSLSPLLHRPHAPLGSLDEKPRLRVAGSGHRKTLSRASVAQIALSKPKMLVLDLDETLIHSTSRMGQVGAFNPVTASSDGRTAYGANTNGLKVRVVEVVLDGRSVIYHVYKRPWVDFFLRKVSKWYTVIIFTASMQEYADPVIDWLDQGRGMISSRLFRDSCTYVNGSYVKDLSIVDPDLARVCLVDNSPVSYSPNPPNGIPIEGWINDPNDEALLDLLPMLDSLRFTNDVRHVLGLRLASTSTLLPSAARNRRTRSGTTSGAVSVSSEKDEKVSQMQEVSSQSQSQQSEKQSSRIK